MKDGEGTPIAKLRVSMSKINTRGKRTVTNHHHQPIPTPKEQPTAELAATPSKQIPLGQ